VNRPPPIAIAAILTISLCAWLGTLVAVSGGAVPATAATRPFPATRTRPDAPPRIERTQARPAVDYEGQVRAILDENCLECHSQDKRKGGLSLATYGDVLEGGRSGPVVRPGSSSRSLILDRLTGTIEPQMPKDELALDPAQIAVIRTWIDQGARLTPTSPAAPQPWEAPMALERPGMPEVSWTKWQAPIDRFVAAYLTQKKTPEPALVSDAMFARRAFLDVWGLLPEPDALQAFLADQAPDKRQALVRTLLADNKKYADHWISYWNDLLRNEDGVSYFSETAGRKSITRWLSAALESNLPFDQFVAKLLNPAGPDDPEGFLIGVNWRGETSAAVKPWMQASQNTAQIFLGINLKCNSCHDSFVSRWKLKDAYSLAAYFAPEPNLQLFRCDVAQESYAQPRFLFPELSRAPASDTLADRRAAAAAIFTDRRMGRMPRTLVNRIWTRLFGVGIVANPDEMDRQPWSPPLLDYLASDFVDHGYDLKSLIETILTSRAYQMPSVTRKAEPVLKGYVFAGPEIRRMTAEQFADAIGAVTGEWDVDRTGAPAALTAVLPLPPPGTAASQATRAGVYARDWRVASTDLTRALGRPIRDQVISIRASQSTTPQALELVNGETLTRWLSRGARRLVGELPPEPVSLYNRSVAGRSATSSSFDIDVSNVSRLWLVVQENGSNDAEIVQPAWADVELSGPSGPVALTSLKPLDGTGLRAGDGPIRVPNTSGDGVRVRNPSVLVYDIAGRGFTRFRGVMGLENKVSDIGATLDPQLRFFIFDTEPNQERLVPPFPGAPLPAPKELGTRAAVIDRVFWHLLGRAPSAEERRIAMAAITDPARGDRPSPAGVADLLWALTMKPEFELIY
jgi:mono/diheme cytochrome c family protein